MPSVLPACVLAELLGKCSATLASRSPQSPAAVAMASAMEVLGLARDNEADAIREVCKAGANPSAGNAFGQTPLHVAALHGNLDAMVALIECGADVNAVNQRSQTPLYFAVSAKQGQAAEAVRVLVAAGADTELADCDGRRPADYAEDSDVRQLLGAPSLALHDAAEEGDAAAVGALLQAGADVNAQDPAGRTALHYAVEEGHSEVTILLLGAKADPNVRDVAGYTALHAAATMRSCPVALFDALLAAGADVHARTLADGQQKPGGPPRGAQVLHLLVHLGMLEPAASVLAAGADASAADGEGDTPLAIALDTGDVAMGALLLQHKANPNTAVGAFASAAAWAVHKNDAVLITTLATCGADLNAADEAGMAPVHLAARAGRDAALQALLASGKVDVNAQTKAGATALHLAALNKRVAAVEALLSAGADRGVKNSNNQTPLDVAKNDVCRQALQA